MARLIQHLLRANDTFLDIGGNEGYFSVLGATSQKGVRVHCVEPQSRLQPIITENFRVNDVTSVTVHKTLLSDSPGTGELFLRPSTNTGASSMYRYWKFSGIRETVPAATLDSFLQEAEIDRVRLVKIDCEGAEYVIMKGAEKSLNAHVFDFIAMEYHPQICGWEKCKLVDSQLREAGYRLSLVEGLTVYHLRGLQKDLQQFENLRVDVTLPTVDQKTRS